MYSTLMFTHSLLRWLVLGAAIYALVRAWRGRTSGAPYTDQDRMGALLFVMAFHLNVVLGIVIFGFASPTTQLAFTDFGAAMKVSAIRFFVMEHPVMMLIAVVIATIGSAKIKRAATDAQKHQRTLVYFGLALLIVMAAIPWPFYPAGRPLLTLPS
jgi:uncharacterized Tic20 family protein